MIGLKFYDIVDVENEGIFAHKIRWSPITADSALINLGTLNQQRN